jgi:hypothetical protein
MKKMPTLFKREFKGKNEFILLNEITEGCDWVLAGEGKATRKYDGTCCLIKDGEIYKRYDAKAGKTPPEGAIPCQEAPDKITGHWPHWVKCDENNPNDKYHISAISVMDNPEDGTYELCGVHFQGNPDEVVEHGDILVKHGKTVLDVPDRSFEGLREYLENHYIEGIVFHRGNGEMCKIKRSDFGIAWENSKR